MKHCKILLMAGVLLAFGGCNFVNALSKSSFTTNKAKVLKVYSTSDAGHEFVAYVVDLGGTEVVVSDPLGHSRHKAGDTIEFMTQKIEISGGKKSLAFMLMK